MALREAVGHVAERAADLWVGQMAREVLGQEDPLDREGAQVAQQIERSCRVAVGMGRGLLQEPLGHRPYEDGHGELVRHRIHEGLDPLLLHRVDGDHGMEGEDERLEVVKAARARHGGAYRTHDRSA